MEKKLKSHGAWIGKWTFILAATGSAVGLGNIWGFPYKAGTNGGGAFVLIYLLCIVMIGVPIMISEIIIGRRAGNSPINAMKRTALQSNTSSLWKLVGWSGITAGVLILSFYSVIAGICLNYIFIAALPSDALSSSAQFGAVIASPYNLLFWHTVFMLLTFLIVSAGVKNGIGRMVKILMPMLGFLLIFMVIYAMFNGAFIRTLEFLFAPDFSNVTAETFLSAMGQAFFSLSLGMGSIMAYGAYMPKDQRVVPTSFTVASLDTLVAMLAGLAIFPIIFAFNLEPNSGPGLVFVSMLSAFNQMQFGQIIGAFFFILLSIAALSSSISLLEPGVAYLSEEGFLFVIDDKTGNVLRITNLFKEIENKKKQIKPTGFVVAKNKVYTTLNNGRLIKTDLASSNQEGFYKVSKSKITRPNVFNDSMYMLKSNAIIKVE